MSGHDEPERREQDHAAAQQPDQQARPDQPDTPGPPTAHGPTAEPRTTAQPPVSPLPGPAGTGEVHADPGDQLREEPAGAGATPRADRAPSGGRVRGLRRRLTDTVARTGLAGSAGRTAAVAGAVAVGSRLAKGAVRAGRDAVAERRHRAGAQVGAGSSDRPLAVTVHRAADDVATHPALDALRAIGSVEVVVTPAPGDRGSEVRVRPVDGAQWSDTDPGEVRAALRDAKATIEAGAPVSPTHPGNARETATNTLLVDLTEHAKEEGRL